MCRMEAVASRSSFGLQPTNEEEVLEYASHDEIAQHIRSDAIEIEAQL